MNQKERETLRRQRSQELNDRLDEANPKFEAYVGLHVGIVEIAGVIKPHELRMIADAIDSLKQEIESSGPENPKGFSL